jgi:hypothetical protein
LKFVGVLGFAALAWAPAALADAPTYATAVNYAVHTNPKSVAIGDVDGDGIPDLVTANSGSAANDVTVRLGNGDGTFAAGTNFAAGGVAPISVAIGDLNRDGNPDLVVANSGQVAPPADPGSLSVLLGAGDGSFGAATTYTPDETPRSVAIADLNRDGKLDVVVACQGSGANHGHISVLLGVGDGTLGAKTDFTANDTPVSVAVGDLNKDGKPDLAVANLNSHDVSSLLGAGDGTFGTATNTDTGGTLSQSIAIGDLNRDGNPDVAVANKGSDNVSVLNGVGNGTFGPATLYGAHTQPFAVAIGDLNRDGRPDIVAANSGSSDISVLTGSGSSFDPAVNVGAHTVPNSVAIADLDRDGKPDLAATNLLSNDVSVLLQTGGVDRQGNFQGPSSYPAHQVPFGIASADFNRDGIPDLASVNEESDDVSVLLGAGDGTMGTAVNYAVGDFPREIAVGDFNRDGLPDLVTADDHSHTVSVLLGTGGGAFGTATAYNVDLATEGVAVGDLNGDGKLDIVTANANPHDVSVLLGNGNGTFGGQTTFQAETGPSAVAIADLNGDGKLDLAVTNDASSNISILLGNGDGSFAGHVNYGSAGFNPDGIAAADLDGDGALDLVTSNRGSGNVSVLMGAGDGTFGTAAGFTVGDTPLKMAVGDITADGVPDIVTSDLGASSVSILRGLGDGTFSAATHSAAGSSPIGVALADYNRDGQLDIAVGNFSLLFGSVSILLQDSTPPATPTITDSDPDSPASDNDPEIKGTAEGGTTVNLYTDAACTGTVAGSGSDGDFASPGITVTVPADSSTTFYATATDGVGNTSDCSTGFTYVEDSTPPSTPSIDSTAPASPANDNSPELKGTAAAVSTVKIYTDAACSGGVAATDSAANFASPGITVSVADNSSTTFYATATDSAGNPSGCSAGRTYVEDSVAPATTIIDGPPTFTNDTTPTFTFSSNEAGSTFKCKLDSEALANCTSPHTLGTVPEGQHTFTVVAIDPAANADGSAATRTFTVDTHPPTTTITKAPPHRTKKRTAKFSFKAGLGGATFECSMDGKPFKPCHSPKKYTRLALGMHTFKVRALDPAGNTDNSPATAKFKIVKR